MLHREVLLECDAIDLHREVLAECAAVYLHRRECGMSVTLLLICTQRSID